MSGIPPRDDKIKMSKLQMIKRTNGTVSYSSNIPIAMIKDLCWEKGDKLTVQIIEHQIRIFKEDSENERD